MSIFHCCISLTKRPHVQPDAVTCSVCDVREKNKFGRRMVDLMAFPPVTAPMRSWHCVLDCKPMQYTNELIRERGKGTTFETANMTLRRGEPWDPTPSPYTNYLDQDTIHTNNFASHPIPLNSHRYS